MAYSKCNCYDENKILDHIIVAGDDYCSLAQKGMLPGTQIETSNIAEDDEDIEM